MKFQIEQIALCPKDPVAAMKLLSAIGMKEWAEDHVVASGYVFGNEGTNGADLNFNYTALEKTRELEVLHYSNGPNWMAEGSRANSVSHLGMHVTEEELEEWIDFFDSRGIKVAQEVYTSSHTNHFLLENGRTYHYVIFDTKEIIGTDLKFIVRINRSGA